MLIYFRGENMDILKCDCGHEIINYHGTYTKTGKKYLLYYCTECNKKYAVDAYNRKEIIKEYELKDL